MIPSLIFIALVLTGIMYVVSSGGGNWIQFFSKGKEVGFTVKDMEQLRRLVASCHIKEPVSIFKSQTQFEKIIRSMVHTLHLSGEYNDPGTQLFLSKLFEHYKKIEMENTENKTRITNSHQISEGQPLRILVAETGVYRSEVIKNMGNNLAISRPVNSRMSSSVEWYGLKISVYFWREDDAGYVFDSEVIDEVFSKGISSLKIEHSDSLFRTQKRKTLRVKFHKAAFLYLVDDNDNPHNLERTAGLYVKMEDISDYGCAFKVKGQASIGLRFKVQFLLNRIPVCVPGTVRSVDYFQESDTSIIHMEADPLPIGTKNYILSEVFDMLPEEDEDELPFRIIEEEAIAAARQPEKSEKVKEEVDDE